MNQNAFSIFLLFSTGSSVNSNAVAVWNILESAKYIFSSSLKRMQRTSGIYSGAIVGIGNHMVCYKAKDESGNESKECCFWIYVRRKCDFWFVKQMDFTYLFFIFSFLTNVLNSVRVTKLVFQSYLIDSLMVKFAIQTICFNSSECTTINRCQKVHCSTQFNQRCLLCNRGYHPDGQTCKRKGFENYR